MRRVISVWLPTWPTDRVRKRLGDALSADRPLVIAVQDGPRRILAAVDRAASAAGLASGMPLARVQALVPNLTVRGSDFAGDAGALQDLAAWCLHYGPLTSADPPAGIWIDITGCAHLFGGETALLEDLLSRLVRNGLAARAAVADTPGAAWALARFGDGAASIVPPGDGEAALRPLSIAALRLTPALCDTLRRLGFDRVSDLLSAPRGPLARRYGTELLVRIDQALGRVFEPITPVFPAELVSVRRAFAEPMLTAEAFGGVIARLMADACGWLERNGLGARYVDLVFERVDGSTQAIRIGTSRPSRDAAHLARLLGERLEMVDPEPGVEAMRLTVSLAEPIRPAQLTSGLAGDRMDEGAIAPLVDRLVARFGVRRVFGVVTTESDVPERAVHTVPPFAPRGPVRSGAPLPRPIRLLDPPQPVEAIALLPDHPPVRFVWRKVAHAVRRADGPERIRGEWWRRDGELHAVRDYFAVEDEQGTRFWLYRRGDGRDPTTGDLRWFLHGIF